MEAVRARHVSLPTEKQAKNRDKIAGDKAGGEEGGKRKNRSGRQVKMDEGEMSGVDFAERDHRTDGCFQRNIHGYDPQTSFPMWRDGKELHFPGMQ